eukprot:5864670-Pyramimonas_sp.AAC.1
MDIPYDRLENDPENSWFSYYAYIEPDSSAARKYLVTLYWCMETIAGITYGDLLPHTDIEIVYSILTMFVAGGTYAYIIGAVCSIATSMNAEKTEFYQAMDLLNRSVREKGLELTVRAMCSILVLSGYGQPQRARARERAGAH